MIRCLGIFRELLHSPRRESDDALILEGVLEELSRLGVRTASANPEQLDSVSLKDWDVLLPMCEAPAALARLSREESGGEVLFVNSPTAVKNCYRTNMIPLLQQHPDIPFPATVIQNARRPLSRRLFKASSSFWMKRGDVHNTCERDVVFISNHAQGEAIRQDFLRRGIRDFVLQRHIPGDLVKFYGVGPGRWGTWFYHNPQTAARYRFDADALDRITWRAARALGLEVYGGDAIASESGALYLIDMNSWPSFARVREQAQKKIAGHIYEKLHSQEALAR